MTFIPQQPGTYVIDVTFNGELVHGEYHILDIANSSIISLTDFASLSASLFLNHSSFLIFFTSDDLPLLEFNSAIKVIL